MRYRQLLSDVKCCTENTHYAQWLLVIRSFALVTMVSAVRTFFCRTRAAGGLSGPEAASEPAGRPSTAAAARTGVPAVEEAFQAAKLGHADVVHHLLSHGALAPSATDGLGRTLLFVAVAHGRAEVAAMLLENTDLFDVNAHAASGNTALHAAAAAGHAALVGMLLAAGADPHVRNPESGATPADVAEMHGHTALIAMLAAEG